MHLQGNLAKAQLRLCFLNVRRVGGQNGSCFQKAVDGGAMVVEDILDGNLELEWSAPTTGQSRIQHRLNHFLLSIKQRNKKEKIEKRTAPLSIPNELLDPASSFIVTQ